MQRRTTILAGAALVLALSSGASAQDAPGTDANDWSATVLPQTLGDALVVGVAVGPDGMVAVGPRTCDDAPRGAAKCWGQVWVSPDGISWQAVDARTSGLALGRYRPILSGPEIGLQGVAYGPAGFLAYGRIETEDLMGQRSAVWASVDGTSWERLSDAATFPARTRFRSILGAEDGYLLGGVIYYDNAPRAAIWSSPDGQDWTRARDTSDDQTFEVGGYIDTLEDPGSGGINAFALYPSSTGTDARLADGVVAVGQSCMPSLDKDPWAWNGACWGQLWRSHDGLTWHRDQGELPRPNGPVWHVASAAERLLIDAPICFDSCASALLLTDDGTSWRVVYGSPVDGELEALLAQEGRFRALLASRGAGIDGGTPALALWASGDGTNWALEESQPVLPVTFTWLHEVDMAVAGDRLVVTVGGETAPDGDFASVVLLSPPLP